MEVRFGISHRNLDTNQRRKVQMSAQTQGLWVVQAKTLDEVDDLFCCNHVESNGIGKLCKVKLHQADAKVQDARRSKPWQLQSLLNLEGAFRSPRGVPARLGQAPARGPQSPCQESLRPHMLLLTQQRSLVKYV